MPATAVPPVAMPDFWTTFKVFTPFHFITLGVCVTLIVGACWLGRRWRGTSAEPRLRWAWAAFILLMQAPSNYYYLVLNWDLQRSLPLHICDLTVLIAAGALLTNTRVLKTMLYFWGIGLSTQGFITPVVQQGLGTGDYWFFWMNHLQIIGSAVYMLVVLKYRPVRRDYLTAIMVSFAYIAAILCFDLALGVNYGYVGNLTPKTPTLIDKMGPWPLRVYMMLGIASTLFAVMWLVWPVVYAVRGKVYPPPHEPV
ncbi:MAG: TIGR02206 family membrane protein [Phycisphaerales bacterium]